MLKKRISFDILTAIKIWMNKIWSVMLNLHDQLCIFFGKKIIFELWIIDYYDKEQFKYLMVKESGLNDQKTLP